MSLPSHMRRQPHRPAYRNRDYTIRRDNMLHALGLSDKIPLGLTGEWRDVEVATGDWRDDGSWGPRPSHRPRQTVVLPYVCLEPRGVANRIRVTCPKCALMMRFCALQQHVDSKACRLTAAYHDGFRAYESGGNSTYLLRPDEAAEWQKGWEAAKKAEGTRGDELCQQPESVA